MNQKLKLLEVLVHHNTVYFEAIMGDDPTKAVNINGETMEKIDSIYNQPKEGWETLYDSSGDRI